MRIRTVLALAGAAAIFLATTAYATTYTVTCGVGSSSISGVGTTFPEPGTDASPDALGALLGTPTQSPTAGITVQNGDLIAIDGICHQDVLMHANSASLSVNPLFITNHTATTGAAYVSTDGIEGQLQIGALGVNIYGITLGSPSGSFSFDPSTKANGNLFASNGAQLFIDNVEILNGPSNGLSAISTAVITLMNSTVSGNAGNGVSTADSWASLTNVTMSGNAGNGLNAGSVSNVNLSNSTVSGNAGNGVGASGGSNVSVSNSTVSGNSGSGVSALGGSGVTLGSLSATAPSPVTITGNGGTVTTGAAGGVEVSQSHLTVWAATISGNSNWQVKLQSASAATITSCDAALPTSVVAPATAPPAISVTSASSLSLISANLLSAACDSAAATVTGSTNGGALLVQGASAVTAQGATLVAASGANPLVEINNGSVFSAFGGNVLCNGTISMGACTPDVGGIVVEVLHDSTFGQPSPGSSGFPALADTIAGDAEVEMQSNLDLGSGAATPSSWTGTIVVAQNSSFRMDGGMTITGQVQIGHGSNGFFNKTAGGSNVVTAGVECLGSTSHIVGPAAVTQTGGGSAVTLVTTGAGCYGF